MRIDNWIHAKTDKTSNGQQSTWSRPQIFQLSIILSGNKTTDNYEKLHIVEGYVILKNVFSLSHHHKILF